MEKIRCKKCNKKINWTFLECRCNNYYCNKHIQPYDHNCNFDHFQFNKNNIEKNNTIPIKQTDKPYKRNTFKY